MTQSSTHTIQPLPNQAQQQAPQLQETNRENSQQTGRDSEMPLTMQLMMFNRERPLLDKIKSMRLE